MDKYDEFHAEIKRLEEEVDYYKDRYDMVCRINSQQLETINTYSKVFMLQEAELRRYKESMV